MSRGRSRAGGRDASRSRRRRRALEHLEPRTLLATLPPPSVALENGVPVRGNVSNPQEVTAFDAPTANETSPSIAVSPNNPNKLVAVWTRTDLGLPAPFTAITEMAYTTDGGLNWTRLTQINDTFPKPVFSPLGSIANPTDADRLPRSLDASVAIDRDDNVYIVTSQNDAGDTDVTAATAGAIVLHKYSFKGNNAAPVPVELDKILYAWDEDLGVALKPTIAVDDTVASYTDPFTGVVQSNPYSGNVYVAWTTINGQIKLVASSDGGNSFSARVGVSDIQPDNPDTGTGGASNFGSSLHTAPRLAVSQGTGDGRVAGGQVTVVWDDFGRTAGLSTITSDTFVGAVSQSFSAQAGVIRDAFAGPDPAPGPRVTRFPIRVNLTDPRFTTVSDIDLRLALTHPASGELTVNLVAPDGKRLPLFDGLDSGTGTIGVGGGGVAFGATFDHEATQAIAGAAEPYIGHFKPAFQFPPPANTPDTTFNLSEYYGLGPNQVNGVWTIEVIDNVLSGINQAAPPRLVDGTLIVTAGANPGTSQGDDRVVATTLVRGLLEGPYPNAGILAASFERGAGPGASIASDNTLGSFRGENQGRLYVALTDRYTFAAASNPDIFLVTSDDGGQTWTRKGQTGANPKGLPVNDDVDARVDGFTGSLLNPEAGVAVGRPQFAPEVAVDRTTGALAVSFYDARHDAQRVRVARTVTTSLDGGATFSNQLYSFANEANAPFDVIARQNVVLGPIPDNISEGLPGASPPGPLLRLDADTDYGFGDRQGMIFTQGRIFTAWSGNANGGPQGASTLDVRVAQLVTAAGPRVIRGTMGQVTTTDVTGTPQVEGFFLEFDRPVDIGTFTAADVVVNYRQPGSSVDVLVPVGEPLPQNTSQQIRATRFYVPFTQSRADVGTYTYRVGPDVRDFGSDSTTTTTTTQTSSPIQAGTAPEYVSRLLPVDIPDNSTTGALATVQITDVPADVTLTDLDVRVSISHPNPAQLILTLIAPNGDEVELSSNNGAGGLGYLGTLFDDQATTAITAGSTPFTGRFRPEQPLAVLNGRSPNGTWTLRVVDGAGGDVGSITEFGLTVGTGATFGALPLTTADGAKAIVTQQVASLPAGTVVSDLDVRVAVDHADAAELTLTLITPAGARIPLADRRRSGNFYNTGVTFDADSLTPINGVGVDPGARYLPDGDLTSVQGQAGNGLWQLEVRDAAGGSVGAVTDFELVFQTERAFDASDTPQAVPRNSVGESRIDVNSFGPAVILDDVDVLVSINHTNDRNLILSLVKLDAAGDEVGRVLLSRNNGGSGDNYTDTLFDDEATTAITAGAAPFTGSFRPEESLSTEFDDTSPNGTWVLEVVNESFSLTGAITDFQLTLRTSQTVGRAASSGTIVSSLPVPARGLAVATTLVSTTPASGLVKDVDVTVSIDHANPQELNLFLVGPTGVVVPLALARGAAVANAYAGTIFDDQAATAIGAAVPPFTGRFRPDGALSAFNDTNANGLWQLQVLDFAGNAAGAITDFELSISTQTTINAAAPSVPATLNDNSTRSVNLFVDQLPIGARIRDVNVRLSINHLTAQDLDIFLVAPDGTTVELSTDNGGDGDNYVNTVFDDDTFTRPDNTATTSITAGTAPFTNIYFPEEALSKLDGRLAFGTWRLRVTDDTATTGSPQGQIVAFQLQIEAAASYGDLALDVANRDVAYSAVEVAGLPATDAIADLDVRLSIDHPNPEQLTLLLVAPNGTQALLSRDNGAGGAANYSGTIFDDQADTEIFDAAAPFTGRFKPEDALSIFNGLNANGVWKLLVSDADDFALDAAVVREFSLSFRTVADYATPPAAIPDPGAVIIPLEVAGVDPTDVLADVDVTVSITHPNTADLTLTLIAPNGRRVELSSGNGGAGDNYTNTIFDDQASIRVNELPIPPAAPFTGRFRPEQSLFDALAGISPNGVWKLEVRDAAGANVGTVDDFRLAIRTAPTFSPILPAPIPDNDEVTLLIPVAGFPDGDLTTDVDLYLTIDHPDVSELEIFLEAPDGTRVQLIRNTPAGGGVPLTGARFTNTVFDDQAAAPIIGQAAPFTGRFRPMSPLDALNGRIANNDWKLIVRDTVGDGEVGAVTDVRLAVLTETTASVLPLPIRDLSTVSSAVFVNIPPLDPDIEEVITGVRVNVSIDHPLAEGLDLYLVAPNGTRIELSSDNGGPAGANYSGTVFDDSAAASIVGAAAPFTGSFRPEQPLAGLNGLSPNGIWRLEIVDDSTAAIVDEGLLTAFSLVIDTGPRVTTVDAAGNVMDQNADAKPGEAVDAYDSPSPADPLSLPLIVPGPRIVSTFVDIPGLLDTADNLVTDQTVSNLVVVFDRDMNPDTFTAVDVLRLEGPGGVLNGDPTTGAPFTVTMIDPRTFRVGFPARQLSGTYTLVLGPDIESVADSQPDVPGGDKIDANRNAGLDFLRGTTDPDDTTEVTFESTTDVLIPVGDPAGVAVEGIADLRDNVDYQFLLQDLDVRINIAFPSAPDLRVELVAETIAGETEGTGEPAGVLATVLLVDRIGQTGTRADFFDTVFNDQAVTPIQNGGPPFQGEYNPQVGQGATLANLNDFSAARRWRLRITNFSNSPANTGLLDEWELLFQKPEPFSGLGEPVADRSTAAFRLFTMDPTNPLSSTTWTAVGPAGVSSPDRAAAAANAEVAGRVNDLAVDPSDPSGNTVYAAAASGGLWKTTNFLTADPTGPTWIPLLDNAPLGGLTIGGLTLVGVNNDPNQTRVFVATGDGRALGDPERPSGTTSRGIGFLRSLDGGATWDLLDSQDNSLPFNAPVGQPQRDHFFAAGNGTTAFRLAADPNPTPGGQVILYAALSDLAPNGTASFSGERGGLWRSFDSGTTWTRLRAGQANDVILDPLSGTGAPDGSLQGLYASFRNEGIYYSNNRGDDLLERPGDFGKPLVQNVDFAQPQPAQGITPLTPNATRFSPNTYGAPVPPALASLGRIQLAKPAPTGDALQDQQYQGWLYASVQLSVGDQVEDFPPILPSSTLYALFVTKDFGQNWTRILAPVSGGLPTNFYNPVDVQLLTPSIDPTGGGTAVGTPYFWGNFSSSLAVDPNDPNVIYFGGADVFGGPSLVRIDTTGIADPHAFYLSNDDPKLEATEGNLRTYVGYDASDLDGAPLDLDESGSPVTLFAPFPIAPIPYNGPYYAPSNLGDPNFNVRGLDPIRTPFLNLIRNPNEPFRADATVLVHGISRFNNAGTKARWTPFDQAGQPDPFDASPGIDPGDNTWSKSTRGYQRIVPVRDPLTGATRIYMANDNGVYTTVDKGDGSLVGSLGDVVNLATKSDGDVDLVNGSRNGNLQIAQFRAGASQATALAGQVAVLQGMFMGNGEEIGQPISDANVIEVGQAGYGNLQWVTPHNRDSGFGVAAQQNFNIDDSSGTPRPTVTGSNVYQFETPAGLVAPDFVGDGFHPATDFFQVNDVGRTFGLVQTQNTGNVPDAQWAFRDEFNFTVNPLSGNQIVIGSGAGRIFRTETAGTVWSEIARPGVDVDGSRATALAYGAPEQQDPTNLGDFIYVGTQNGNVFYTLRGGAPWNNLSTGLDGTPVRSIVTNPTRGSHETYAITDVGVYYMPDATAAGAAWQPIIGDLFDLQRDPFGNADFRQDRLQTLTSLAVDYRYAIPDGAGGAYPILYVAGDSGVFRSLDRGQSWLPFPAADPGSLDNTPVPPGDGGGLPAALVTDLDLVLGAVDPTNGRPQGLVDPDRVDTPPGDPDPDLTNNAVSPNVLLATTYGRGAFALRLSPVTLATSLQLSDTLPDPGGSDSGVDPTDRVTNVLRPVITGYGQQSAFGNFVRVNLYNLTGDPANRVVIGTGATDETGLFTIQINDGVFLDDDTQSLKTIGVQAFDQADTPGNIALFSFTLDTQEPLAPVAPDLQAASDSGDFNDDNITSLDTLTFDVAGVEPDATLNLYRQPVGGGARVLVRTLVGVAGGTIAIDDPGPLTSGQYDYTAEQVDLAGNASPLGDALRVTVDQNADAPAAPDLQAASDDGDFDDDNITSQNLLTFDVAGVEPGATLRLYRQPVGGARVLARTLVGVAGGTIAVQDPTILLNGQYDYTAEQVDPAGNTSPLSAALRVTVANSPDNPPPGPIDLVASSDLGRFDDDDVTQATVNQLPLFDVAFDPLIGPVIVELVRKPAGAPDADYQVVNSADTTPADTSPVRIADPGPIFSDGTFTYAARYQYGDTSFSAFGATLQVRIDNTPPGAVGAPDLVAASDSGTSSTDNVTNDDSPTFNVAGVAPGSLVRLLRDGVIAAELVSDAGGVVTLTTDGDQPDGTFLYRAVQIDLAGNIGPLGATLSVVIDTIGPDSAPDAPNLQTASDSGEFDNDDITSDTSPTFDVSVPADLAGRGLELLRKPQGAADSAYVVVDSAAGAGAFSDPNVPAGVYQYAARALDTAGNPGAFSTPLTVTIDDAAPAAPDAPDLQAASDLGRFDDDDVTNANSLAFTINGVAAGAFVELFRDDQPGQPVVRVRATTAGSIILTDAGPVPVGLRTYSARQVDLAGNISGRSPDLAVTVDRTDPAAPPAPDLQAASDSGASSTDNLTNADVLSLRIVGVEDDSTAQLFRDGDLVGTLDADGTINLDAPDEGTFRFTVRQVDLAGNLGLASPELVVTVDRTGPGAPPAPDLAAASDTGGSSTDNLTSDLTPTFDVAGVEAGAAVQLLRDGLVVASRVGPGPITDDGSLEGPPADGPRDYALRQVDLAGNPGPAGPALVVTIDSTLPAPPDAPDLQAASDTGASSTDNLTGAPVLQFNLTGVPDGLTVQLLRGGTVVASRVGPGSIADDDATPDGDYSYSARVLSALGNPGTPGPALAVTVDRTAPAAPDRPDLDPDSDSGPSAIDDVTAVRSPSFDVAGVPAGRVVQLLRDGLVVASRVGPGPVADPGPVPDGSFAYTTRALDAAGNPSAPSAPLSVTVDGAAPAPTLTLLPDDDTGAKGDNRTSNRRPRLIGVTDPGAAVDLIDAAGRLLGTATAAADGSFTLRPSEMLPVGAISLQARARDLAGNVGASAPLALRINPLAAADYDGDGATDLGVYGFIAAAGSGRFLIDRTTGPDVNQPFGGPADFPMTGDYDGDGLTDLGTFGYSPDEGFARFAVILSGGGVLNQPFGGPFDIPMAGDYDGDGQTDLAVYGFSPDNGFTRFAVLLSGGGDITLPFGGPDDIPMAGDYDGDGTTDLGVYGFSPDNGFSRFAVLLSGGPSAQYPAGNITLPFGGEGDLPVGGDYDGDGRTDPAVYGFSPADGVARFAILPSAGGPALSIPFGVQGDIGLPPSSALFIGVGRGEGPVQLPTSDPVARAAALAAAAGGRAAVRLNALANPGTSAAATSAAAPNLGASASRLTAGSTTAAAGRLVAQSPPRQAPTVATTDPTTDQRDDALASAIDRLGRLRLGRLRNRPRST